MHVDFFFLGGVLLFCDEDGDVSDIGEEVRDRDNKARGILALFLTRDE